MVMGENRDGKGGDGKQRWWKLGGRGNGSLRIGGYENGDEDEPRRSSVRQYGDGFSFSKPWQTVGGRESASTRLELPSFLEEGDWKKWSVLTAVTTDYV